MKRPIYRGAELREPVNIGSSAITAAEWEEALAAPSVGSPDPAFWTPRGQDFIDQWVNAIKAFAVNNGATIQSEEELKEVEDEAFRMETFGSTLFPRLFRNQVAADRIRLRKEFDSFLANQKNGATNAPGN